jgi:hypothetical protein
MNNARDQAQTSLPIMSASVRARLGSFWRAEFLSPKDLLRRAVVIALLFLVVHLAGLREFTSILNGTMGSPEIGWKLSAFLGLVYIFAYLAFVLLVPLLLLASAFLAAWNRFFSRIIPG